MSLEAKLMAAFSRQSNVISNPHSLSEENEQNESLNEAAGRQSRNPERTPNEGGQDTSSILSNRNALGEYLDFEIEGGVNGARPREQEDDEWIKSLAEVTGIGDAKHAYFGSGFPTALKPDILFKMLNINPGPWNELQSQLDKLWNEVIQRPVSGLLNSWGHNSNYGVRVPMSWESAAISNAKKLNYVVCVSRAGGHPLGTIPRSLATGKKILNDHYVKYTREGQEYVIYMVCYIGAKPVAGAPDVNKAYKQARRTPSTPTDSATPAESSTPAASTPTDSASPTESSTLSTPTESSVPRANPAEEQIRASGDSARVVKAFVAKHLAELNQNEAFSTFFIDTPIEYTKYGVDVPGICLVCTDLRRTKNTLMQEPLVKKFNASKTLKRYSNWKKAAIPEEHYNSPVWYSIYISAKDAREKGVKALREEVVHDEYYPVGVLTDKGSVILYPQVGDTFDTPDGLQVIVEEVDGNYVKFDNGDVSFEDELLEEVSLTKDEGCGTITNGMSYIGSVEGQHLYVDASNIVYANLSEEDSVEDSTDESSEAPADVSKDAPSEASKASSEDTAEDTPEDTLEDTPQDSSEESIKDSQPADESQPTDDSSTIPVEDAKVDEPTKPEDVSEEISDSGILTLKMMGQEKGVFGAESAVAISNRHPQGTWTDISMNFSKLIRARGLCDTWKEFAPTLDDLYKQVVLGYAKKAVKDGAFEGFTPDIYLIENPDELVVLGVITDVAADPALVAETEFDFQNSFTFCAEPIASAEKKVKVCGSLFKVSVFLLPTGC